MPTRAEVEQMLTGPGGGFEIVEEEILGVTMKTFKQRLPSLRDVSRLAAMRGDDSPYIVFEDREVGFTSFVKSADAVGASLANDFGIEKGDRIAVLSQNNPEWCLTFWAAVDMGAVLVGLNGWWNTDEIIYGLQDSGSRVLVADRARLERIAPHLDDLDELKAVFLIDGDPSGFGDDPRIHRFDALLEAGSGMDPVEPPIGEDDPAVIFYTSGTTGRPKGAISTHRSMIANLQNSLFMVLAGAMANPEGALADVSGSGIVSLLTSPLFHVSGCHSGMVVGLMGGVKLVIASGKFEPAKAMQLIQDHQVTIWTAVPTMVWRVVEDPARFNYNLSSIKTVTYGGSPSGSELQRRVQETFPNVRSMGNAYGLTETSSLATLNTGEDIETHPESVGRALPVVDIRISGPSGEALGAGRIGEIWIKGPIVMPGYWGKPEATAEVISEGWLRTGDIGYLDTEGFLYITDRAKDMIIRGGENVYCVEIENRLEQHPAVIEAAVIGVPHQTLGEEVKAIVRVDPDATVNDKDIKSWVAAGLASFKVPEYVEITYALLPRNASGKLLKNVLRGSGEVPFTETM